jgi:hypothetical protein
VTDGCRDKQGKLYENISVQFAGQSQLIQESFNSLQTESVHAAVSIHRDVLNILATLFPVATSVKHISSTLKEVSNDLSRLVCIRLALALAQLLTISRKRR